MKKIKIKTEFITLGQLLKYVGMIPSGALAKEFLSTEKVLVNQESEVRRGRKLYPGYEIVVNDEKFMIE